MSEDSGMWVKVFPEYAGGTVEGSPPAPVLTNPEGGGVVAFTSGGEGDGGPTLAYGAEISPNDNGETVTVESDDPTVGGEVAVLGTSPDTDYVVKVYGVNVAGRGNASSTAAFQLNYNVATGGDVPEGEEFTVTQDLFDNQTGDYFGAVGDRWRYHKFTNVGTNTFTVTKNPNDFRVLAVAGGGASASNYGSGGGAGGMVEHDTQTLPTGTHTITVGSGGAGGYVSGQAARGGDSSIGSLVTAKGGGGGGSQGAAAGSGGSGGGASKGGTPGSGIAGQGHKGGLGTDPHSATGGGGGAGGAATGPDATPGPGKASDINGNNVTYARGGAGTTYGGTTFPNSGYGRGGYAEGREGGNGIVIVAYQIGLSTTRQIEQAEAEAAAREAGYESGYSVGVEDGREEAQEELRSMAASTLEASE